MFATLSTTSFAAPIELDGAAASRVLQAAPAPGHEVGLTSLCPRAESSSPRIIRGEIAASLASPLVSVDIDCAAVAAGATLKTPYDASTVTFHDATWKDDGKPCAAWNGTQRHAAQRAWLDAVEGHRQRASSSDAMACYFSRTYPTIPRRLSAAVINTSLLDFFWSHAPTLGAVDTIDVASLSFSTPGRCPLPERSLWVILDDASMHPARFACAKPESVRQCGSCGQSPRGCVPRILPPNKYTPSFSCLFTATKPTAPTVFPGFFTFRSGSELLEHKGVRDGAWVEVMRVARLDDRYGGLRAPGGVGAFEAEMALVGQVWFWVARGSGVWLNVGRSLRLHGPTVDYARRTLAHTDTLLTCREARARNYDTIQRYVPNPPRRYFRPLRGRLPSTFTCSSPLLIV